MVSAFAALLTSVTLALVTARPLERAAQTVTPLSTDEIDSLTPFTQFARAAYCGLDNIQNWSCGEACDANGDFEVTLSGGDGNEVQWYYVGYSPSLNAIITSHEGTDPTEFESVLTDGNITQGALDSTLFPGVPDDVAVHEGFRDVHAQSAQAILDEVNKLIGDKGTSKVITTGHSLGAALALLDATLLKLNIPDADVSAVTYGMPRVGNPEYASFYDSNIGNLRRVNHAKDLIPIIPGRGLGFGHPQGEIHMIDDDTVVACDGNDNADDDQCQIKTVPNIFDGSIADHLGPYHGDISIGTIFCT